jgi:predicted RNase H-like nuclease
VKPAVVLGIDAAWGAREPSGVALARLDPGGWRCLIVAPSYQSFVEAAIDGRTIDWSSRAEGGEADVNRLLEAASRVAGAKPDIVCLDMPVSRSPITGRRAADQQISQAYGSRQCGTHSPTATRPGTLGERLANGLYRHGYSLATRDAQPAFGGVLLEVYPHPAIVELLGLERRLEYKVSKSCRFWPRATLSERRRRILGSFQRLRGSLSEWLGPLPLELPTPEATGTLSELKRFEDALDAVVCCWVGTRYHANGARAFGSERDAIWCPLMPRDKRDAD